ncbi:MAG: hypothetical protein KC609_22255, partial [Myxococcales bacterium]|nr:hypothetical protein [Myxococcales bacterium]
GLGQVCLAIENVQAPSGKDFYCSAQYLRHSGVCRVPQKSGDDALYLVGINVTDYDYKLDIVFQQMENGGVIQTQIPVEDTWLAGSEVVMCSGPMAGMVVSGEGVDFYAFRLDDQLKWNEDDNIYEALANAGGAIVNGAPISLFSLTTTDDKLVTYWGGYFRSTSLQAPGESSPTSHKDFLVRCIDDSLSTTGYSCEPRFLKIHDGTTDIDNSDTLMPPYTDTTPAVTGIWGYWKGDVETLQTMTNIRVNFSGSADDFGYWLSNASVDGDVWGYDAPTGCIGWKGGTCDTFPSWELDYEYYSDWNRGMYSIDGMNGKTMIAASPKVPLFDSNNLSVNQNPDNAPNVAPLFYNDGTGFVALQYPTGALLKDAKHFDGAPYEFLFDHVRFLSDEQVLLVGHYRTCLTDGCYNTLDVENSVTVKTQPFLTTYNQTSKTFGPMIPIGSGFEQTCCTGPACQSVPNCLRYQMDAFWFGARILGVNLRKHANGVEIYMTQSPAVDSGQGYMTFARKPIVYSYLSIKP